MAHTHWTNRITRYGEESPDQLLAHPLNFRTHPKTQQDALSGVLTEVGVVQNVIVNERTGHVVDGHLRIALAMRQNQPTIPVTYVDLSPEEEALILATLDPISAMAGADRDKLDELLRDVSTSDAAVMAMLSDLAESAGVVGFGATVGLTDPDDVPDPPAEPITQPGDLWLLGRHRLLCGDSTKAEDVARLMAGEKADMVFTDPPYGMDYHGTVFGKQGISNDTESSWEAVLCGAIMQLRKYAPNAVIAICCGASRLDRFFASTSALTFHRLLTIYKPNRLAKPWRGWIMTSEHITLFSLGSPTWIEKNHCHDVYTHDYSERPARSVDHPTVKPLSIVSDVVGKASLVDDLILDLFGGSGSTLIACEQTNRRCAMMEIDPTYCDVIIRRWENFTGLTATRAPEAMAAD
jgi:DNA modification methylase